MNGIYSPGMNPALALYAAWKVLLQARTDIDLDMPPRTDAYLVAQFDLSLNPNRFSPSVAYGANGWSIGVVGYDLHANAVIGYFPTHAPYTTHPALTIAPDGRFVVRPFHNSETNRQAIREHTFLKPLRTKWGTRWMVEANHYPTYSIKYPAASSLNTLKRLYDWRDPPQSVSHKAILGLTWSWWEAVADGDGWKLEPSEFQNAPACRRVATPPDQECHKEFRKDALRMARYYRRQENEHRAELGLPKVSDHPARLRDGSQILEPQDLVDRFAGLLTTKTPPTTTSLRREAYPRPIEEAQTDG